MQYRTAKCPHCSHTLEFMAPVQFEMGSPIKKCPSCGGNYFDSNVVEWESLSLFGKVGYILRFGLSLFIFNFFGVVFVIGLFFLGFLHEWLGTMPEEKAYYWSFVIGIPVGLLNFTIKAVDYYQGFKFQIAKSRERMSDPDYASLIKTMGIVPFQGKYKPKDL